MGAFALFILLMIGLAHTIFPYACWQMQIGWKIKDAEPSDDYIILSRVLGGSVSVVALIILVVVFIKTDQQEAHAMDGWHKFQSEMTVNNIVSMHDSYNDTSATPAEIKTFVQDLQGVTAKKEPNNTNFSAMDIFQIKCADGYTVFLENRDDSGNFGIEKSNYDLPDYVFTSRSLENLVQEINNR